MKKKRMIKKVVCILIVLLLTVDLCVANYLVTFAIAHKEGDNYDVVPKSIAKSEGQKLIEENEKRISEKTESWLETVTTEELVVTSDDGLRLVADYFQNDEESHRYVILVHGYTGRRLYMREYAVPYVERSYSVLIPDLRSHGDSEGDYIGMGWLDRKDLLKWINLLTEKDSEAKIVLHGISMGGATVMMTSGEELPDNVVAVVEDCGYTSVWDVFSDEIESLFHVPTFPLLDTASLISELRAGYGFK